MLGSVLQAYGINGEVRIEKLGHGLINSTWKVTTDNRSFVLQRLNSAVFESPASIARNIRLIADYLKVHCPEYLFVAPLTNANGDDMVRIEQEGHYRLSP